ncbi:hypothetical protein F2P81_021562 [Scophthalmus maximus]|uniref:Uncharacterized protein n=1 Tax=Scophthalmus maximus TaxID=52904 RepID=A0A6A4S3L3_SCOMX|nr:hypothetical protein F2P81_021562 [Scophthalmus maximus]
MLVLRLRSRNPHQTCSTGPCSDGGPLLSQVSLHTVWITSLFGLRETRIQIRSEYGLRVDLSSSPLG